MEIIRNDDSDKLSDLEILSSINPVYHKINKNRVQTISENYKELVV